MGVFDYYQTKIKLRKLGTHTKYTKSQLRLDPDKMLDSDRNEYDHIGGKSTSLNNLPATDLRSSVLAGQNNQGKQPRSSLIL